MWEFVPCIDHPAAENLEAIDVRFELIAKYSVRQKLIGDLTMKIRTFLVASCALLASMTFSLAQSQPNFGPNAPATGDSFGKPPSGAQPPLSGHAAYLRRVHHAHRHMPRETTGESSSQK